MDQALPPERRAPVTPSSSSRYHRRRSSGSRDERYRSGKAPEGGAGHGPLVCEAADGGRLSADAVRVQGREFGRPWLVT